MDEYQKPKGNEPTPTNSPKKCQEEKEKLGKSYTKAFTELSRLKGQYEAFSKSSTCADSVGEGYKNKASPLRVVAEKLAKQSREASEVLKDVKPRLESALGSNKALQKQVTDLKKQAGSLASALPDLNKVKDALDALALCPGLDKPEFKMPKWTGKWVSFHQDAALQLDEEQDKAMSWACNKVIQGSRAAEHAEIEQGTISNFPDENTAKDPLMGVCPSCEGEDDASFKSGHARNCWKPGSPLNTEGISKMCGKGKKVILCVVDQVGIEDF